MATVSRLDQLQHLSPQEKATIKDVKKLSIGEKVGCAALIVFGLAVGAGCITPLCIKIGEPIGGFLSTIPGGVSAAMIIGGIVWAKARGGRVDELFKKNLNENFRAALCLQYSSDLSIHQSFKGLFEKVFAGDSPYQNSVTKNDINKFLDRLLNTHHPLYLEQSQRVEIYYSIFSSKFLADHYSDLRNQVLNAYGNEITQIKFESVEPHVYLAFKYLTHCTAYDLRVTNFDFVPHLPNHLKSLTLVANNVTNYSGDVSNSSVENLTIKILDQIGNLKNIVDKFKNIKMLTVECTERVDETRLREVIDSIGGNIQQITFTPHSHTDFNYKTPLNRWIAEPAQVGHNTIMFKLK